MSLVVIVGPMFSGKTTRLLQHVKNEDVVCYKHSFDNRYHGIDFICSHDSFFTHSALRPCTSVSTYEEILPIKSTIIVDEIQFFEPETVKYLDDLSIDYSIVVAGLETDYLGNPFPTTAGLMAVADNIVKLKSECVKCGKDATRNYRLTDSKELVEIGNEGKYEPRCKRCFRH